MIERINRATEHVWFCLIHNIICHPIIGVFAFFGFRKISGAIHFHTVDIPEFLVIDVAPRVYDEDYE
jgi:hypothetical protein